MGKHSKRRRDSSSSSDDEDTLKKKLRRIQKQLKNLDKGRGRSPSNFSSAVSRNSRSPAATSTRTDDLFYLQDSERLADNEGFVYPEKDSENSVTELTEDNVKENNPPLGPELDESVLAILGYELPLNKNPILPFHADLAVSWTNTIQKGLKDEDCTSLMNKYTPPDNCPLLKAPELNLEIAAASREPVVRRDKKLSQLQNQIGSALSGLGQVLTCLLKEPKTGDNLSYIETISDSCRLLLDFQNKQSQTRRDLVLIDLKKEVKETLSNVQVDNWLFGDKLADRLKASKEVERSGLSLKPSKAKLVRKNPVVPVSRNLNYKRPLHQQGGYQSGRRLQHQNPPAPQNRAQNQVRSYHLHDKRRSGKQPSRPKYRT